MEIPHGQWHDVTIEIGGENGTTVTVKHLRAGADETESFEAETTIPGGGRIGFGVGSEADFRFDDVGTREDVTLTASTALRYHYDANGRVVGRTLDPGEVTEESQFFIYDGDRIIQELDENGNLVAAWDYGVYIDEILVMYRDVEPPAGLEPYYYLQDDHYNVIALADATGALVERYAYDDYGAPTIYNGDGTETRATSAYFNPFLFQADARHTRIRVRHTSRPMRPRTNQRHTEVPHSGPRRPARTPQFDSSGLNRSGIALWDDSIR